MTMHFKLGDPLDPRMALSDAVLDQPALLCIDERDMRFVRLDYADYAWAAQWVWAAHFNQRGILYPARQEGTWPGVRRRVYLHRAIMERIEPPPSPEHVVDHKNGDTLDARRCNLRWVTISENAKNTWLWRLAHGAPA